MRWIVAKVIGVIQYTYINAKIYWGASFFVVFFLLALLWLAFYKQKNEKDRFVLRYVFGVGIVYFFPVTAWIIIRCIGDTYWRMFWLFPVAMIIAYVIIRLLEQDSCKEMKITVFILAVLLLMVGGEYLYTEANFDYHANVYGVPQSTIDVCEVLRDDMRKYDTSEQYVVVSEEFSPWIRVYDPSIKLLYGRSGYIESGEREYTRAQEVYGMLSVVDGNLDWNRFTSALKEENCGYFVSVPERISEQDAIEQGFRIVNKQESFIVLALN